MCPPEYGDHRTHSLDIVYDCVHALALDHADYSNEEGNIDGGSESLIQRKLNQGVLDAEDLLRLQCFGFLVCLVRDFYVGRDIAWEAGFDEVLPVAVQRRVQDRVGHELEDWGNVKGERYLAILG